MALRWGFLKAEVRKVGLILICLVISLSPTSTQILGKAGKITNISNPVDGHGVPVPHYGVVMNFDDWEVFSQKVSKFIDDFIIEPYVRFKGEPGEQGTMFFQILLVTR